MAETAKITLSGGHFAIVDAADYDWLSQWNWSAHVDKGIRVYARRNTPRVNGGNQGAVHMHRAIVDAPKGMVVDHINHNTLDNRRANLRLCTVAENSCNRLNTKNSTSRFLGVSWNTRAKKWVAQLQTFRNNQYLGAFGNEEDAARAYDTAAVRVFGEYAKPNFPAAIERGEFRKVKA